MSESGSGQDVDNVQPSKVPAKLSARVASGRDHDRLTLSLLSNNKNELAGNESNGSSGRSQWSNKLEFILACTGYAVGLGNIWRFPWLLQKNGGGAFLIPYFVMLIIEGIPVFYLEISLGQRMQLGAIPCWKKVSRYSSGLGYTMFATAMFGNITYATILVWCFYYFFVSFQSPLPWASCPKSKVFDSNVNKTIYRAVPECETSDPVSYYWYHDVLTIGKNIDDISGLNWKLVLCSLCTRVVLVLCLIKGIKTTGKVVYFTVLFPYVVLLIFLIRGLTLEGYQDGLTYLFTPEWSRLKDPYVWLQAASQIFFSLSLASGGLIAYASYNPIHNDTLKDTFAITLINSGTSILAAVAMFSLLGYRANFQMKNCMARRNKQIWDLDNRINSTMYSMYNVSMISSTRNDLIWEAIKSNLSASFTVEECSKRRYLEEGSGGTGFAFITMAEVINQLPGSTFFSIVFFLMLITVGLDSSFGGIESMVTSLRDLPTFKKIRNEYVVCFLNTAFFLVGLIYVSTVGEYILQITFGYSADIIYVINAFAELVTVVGLYGLTRFCNDIEYMTGRKTSIIWKALWGVISPAAIAVMIVALIISATKKQLKYAIWEYAQRIGRAANPGRGLQPHDIELQRAPVISYEELLGDRRPLFQ